MPPDRLVQPPPRSDRRRGSGRRCGEPRRTTRADAPGSVARALRPAAGALLVFVFGCTAGPDYHRPALDLPATYTAAPLPAQAASAAEGEAAGPHLNPGLDIPAQWWNVFHSAALDALVRDGLAANPDLASARAALRAARENALAATAGFAPQVSLGYSATRQAVAEPLASPAASGASYFGLQTAAVNVSYMPDVFGATRRTVESAQAQAESQRFELEATWLTLTSNLVLAAITEASLRGQRAVTLAVIAGQRDILESNRRQLALGQVAEADVSAQEATLAATEASLPPLEKQLAQQESLLARLAGRYPNDARAGAAFDLDALELPRELPLSVPSSLVEHRPDVRAAEAQLRAASADIGIAAAARLPSMTLGVDSYGWSATTLARLFSASSVFWTLAAGVSQPVFDGGALQHREQAARAVFDQASAQYRATVLSAFQDTANSLQAIDIDNRALQAAARAERANASNLARTRQRVELGDASALELRVAEVAQLQLLLNLVQARAARFGDAAALFQSLGGGWWNRAGE